MVIQAPLDISTHFKDVKRQLWRISFDEKRKLDQAKCDDIQRRLSYFNENHTSDLDYIYDVIQALSKGLYLIQSGLEWCEPSVG
jgi:hypothetical protein